MDPEGTFVTSFAWIVSDIVILMATLDAQKKAKTVKDFRTYWLTGLGMCIGGPISIVVALGYYLVRSFLNRLKELREQEVKNAREQELRETRSRKYRETEERNLYHQMYKEVKGEDD